MATQRYTIQSGDTLTGLAKKNSTTVDDLLKLNPTIKDANKIYTGAGLDIGRYTPPVTPPVNNTIVDPVKSIGKTSRIDANGNIVKTDPTTGQDIANIPGYTAPGTTAPGSTTPPVTRYTNPYDSAASAADAARITQFTASDANAIREEKRRNAQAQIDSINQASDINRADTEQQNLQNSGRTRAILSNAGIIGTGRGLEKTTSTETFNKQQLASVEAERSAKINAILADVEDKASQEIAAKRLEAQGNMNAHLDFLKGNVESAKANVKNLAELATKGGTIEENLDAKDIEDIMRQTGYSKLELDSIWNGNLPESTKTTYQDVTTQNSSGNAVLTRIGINPVTGKTTKTEYDLGIPYTDVAKGSIEKYGKDGLMIVYPNGTHKVLVGGGSSGNGTGSGAVGTYVPGADKITDSYVIGLQNGTYKTTDVPAAYKNKVAVAMASQGNTLDGKPSVTELGKSALTSAKMLMQKVTDGTGFAGSVGAKGISSLFGIKGTPMAGSQASDFASQFDALKSQLSLDGVKYLKGQGAVSDAERALLASATSNLNRSQSEAEFKKSLQAIIDKLSGTSESELSTTSETSNNPIPKGTDGTEYGYPGYESDGTQWVLKEQ